ncbi:MAG: rod shape-determining protein MreC [Pseudanabaenaceae cyanobacterium]
MAQVGKGWWRYSWQISLICLGIYAAFLLRQGHSMLLGEIYAFLSRPFQGTISVQEYLRDAQVQGLEARIAELENQIAQLQSLLQLPPPSKPQAIWAPVIGRSADAWWQQLLIGRGREEGIQPGAVVEGQGGLVGRVTKVGEHSSQVLLISDMSSQVGVMVSRSRVMGILRGQNQNTGLVEFFVRDADVKAGDIVVTSPVSSLFPQGIPVGRVRSVDVNKQPAPEAIVEFLAPLGLLEYVRVLPS